MQLPDGRERTALGTSTVVIVIVALIVVAGVGYYFIAATPGPSPTTSFTTSQTSSTTLSSTLTTTSAQTSAAGGIDLTAQRAADDALYQTALKNGETTLVVYSTLTASQFPAVQTNFNQLYPGITLQYTNTPPTTALTLISSQEQAQGHSADIVQLSYSTVYTLYQSGYVTPYVSPYYKTFPASALDPLNASTPTYSLPTTFVYNTNLVKTPPTTLSQIASSTYKGNVYMLDPTAGTSSTAFFGTLAGVLGNSTVNTFFQQLQANVKPSMTTDQGSVSANVASGQYAFGLVALMTDAIPLIDQGAPMKLLNITGMPVLLQYTNTGVLKGALHPNAAKLFIDYVSSPQGQAVIGSINIRFPVNSNIVTTYTLNAALAKYASGQKTVQYPSLAYLKNAAAYQATYKSIFSG